MSFALLHFAAIIHMVLFLWCLGNDAIRHSTQVIGINQDALGVAGDLVWKQGPNEVRGAAGSVNRPETNIHIPG